MALQSASSEADGVRGGLCSRPPSSHSRLFIFMNSVCALNTIKCGDFMNFVSQSAMFCTFYSSETFILWFVLAFQMYTLRKLLQ